MPDWQTGCQQPTSNTLNSGNIYSDDMPNQTLEPPADTIFSVSAVNRLARSTLEQNFTDIRIEGEISELLQHRSGHWYFTLKDEQSQLRVAMFRGANSRVRFKPADGQLVLLKGQLSIYEARGSYQFIASSMQPTGEGKLQREFEQLKQKLQLEGLFAADTKQALPAIAKQIVLVTSPQGAALKDILTVFKRRHAGIELIVAPVAVQGEDAARQIADSISQINQLASNSKHSAFNPDAIIVGRGGGSLEDLWSFNEEVVARAIYASQIPIVSAVGHETDFSIADFVADVRAATPSAAAELLSPDSQHLADRFSALLRQLTQQSLRSIAHQRLELNALSSQIQHPAARLRQYAMSLDHLDTRLLSAVSSRLNNVQGHLRSKSHDLKSNTPALRISSLKASNTHLENRLIAAQQKKLQLADSQLERNATALNIVSPLATLGRGYSIIYDEKGAIAHSVTQLNSGDTVQARLNDGVITAEVKETTDATSS